MAVHTPPRLEVLDPTTRPAFSPRPPTRRILEADDVATFLTSRAYRDIGLFIMQLNRAVCPRAVLPPDGTSSAPPLTFSMSPSSSSSRQQNEGDGDTTRGSSSALSSPVVALQDLLGQLARLVDEAPPVPGPRRFGNLGFRAWHALLGDRAGRMLASGLLGETLAVATAAGNDAAAGTDAAGGPLEEVRSYLLGSFGSPQRLDYGTGHELSFVAFLGCLWKLGHFSAATAEKDMAEIEREIVFAVIEPYLALVRNLITTYTLEPAGSHGVWGLDDHFFVPYIFGSAQLTRPIAREDDPVPLEGSVRGAPRTADIVKPLVVDEYRRTNMYFSAIGFINDIKKGPFWEHSPMLFDISGVRDGWGKINKGMIKMYNAEVLSKFPVVQHFSFGSLFSWEKDAEAAALSNQLSATPALSAPSASSTGSITSQRAYDSRLPPTAEPGATGRMPPPIQWPTPAAELGVPATKAPWAK